MQTHRALFTLKGNNIGMTSPLKVTKHNKVFTHLPDPTIQHSNDVQLMIRIKQTLPIRKPASHSIHHQNSHSETQNPEQHSPLCPQLPIKTQHQSLHVSETKIFSQEESISPLRRGREHYSSMKGKRCNCGDCNQCLKDFPYFLRLFSDNQHLPDVSAKSWCVWKKKRGKYAHYYGKRIHKVREIASLTKMVTALTAIQFLEKNNLDPEKVTYRVRKTSTLVGGTTANLQEGQLCTLQELFYGMMLPSGNDAAIAISEAVGLLSYLRGKGRQVKPEEDGWDSSYTKNYAYVFIGMMNERCHRAGTLDTKCNNSHGNDPYDYYKNVSTCHQIARIASEFMLHPFLKGVAATSKWGPYQNTNKLLEDGFDGIKTGITETAGPCLAASYKDIIIVVLNSKSMNQRWLEVKKLVKWILSKG